MITLLFSQSLLQLPYISNSILDDLVCACARIETPQPSRRLYIFCKIKMEILFQGSRLTYSQFPVEDILMSVVLLWVFARVRLLSKSKCVRSYGFIYFSGLDVRPCLKFQLLMGKHATCRQ